MTRSSVRSSVPLSTSAATAVPAAPAVVVSGGATAEEVAVVLAIMQAPTLSVPEPDGYLRWRAGRQAALGQAALRQAAGR